MGRPAFRARAFGLAALVALVLPGLVRAATPEEELAARFAPVVRLVEQTEECGPGEPFEPSDVDAFLGNPSVALRGPWAADNLVKVAPTERDLATAPAEYYLDFPGNPLKPGCDYERWARAATADFSPTVYAHVA